ncbi:hypothetical protein BGZ46_004609 [Entomortierella lignicola]|nr:hypothetical protein BGZ46_004609 [Entomortierella lignicola]
MTAEQLWPEYYWKAFNDLVKQNRKTLVSLTLKNVSLPTSKPNDGGPYSSLLMIIANYPHSNLKVLRIGDGELPYRYLPAFWDLCERVEVLELYRFPFEMPHHYIDRRATSGTRMPPQEERVVHFSNLLELTLIRSGPKSPLSQLEEVIRKAPKLKKLDWTPCFSIWFPLPRFIYLFTGDAKYFRPTTPVTQHSAPLETCTTPCWPDLESLKIDCRYSGHFDVEDYFAILEMSKKIRFLYVPVSPTFPTELEPLFRLHSHTLTMVDWRNNLDIQNVDLIRQIFSSCPLLTKAYFQPIHGQELIRGGDSWVCCDQLEELGVCINMDPLEYDPHNPQRKQDLSWAVFKQLGKLRNLRILDLRHHTSTAPFTEHLEFTTSMGLQQLSVNELEVIRFHANQNMTLEDVNWIIEHWTSLAEIDGEMLTSNHSFSTRKNPWDYTLATMLNKRGVRTPKDVYS